LHEDNDDEFVTGDHNYPNKVRPDPKEEMEQALDDARRENAQKWERLRQNPAVYQR
jgi:hypothetical protein